MCLVATKDVAPGAELLSSYGHEYWCAHRLGRVPAYSAAVAEAEAARQEQTREWRIACQAEYAPEIETMAGLVRQMVYSDGDTVTDYTV